MKAYRLAPLCIAALLAGCNQDQLIEAAKGRPVPAEFLKLCEKPEPPKTGEQYDVLGYAVDATTLLNACAVLNKQKADFIKDTYDAEHGKLKP